MEAATEKLVGGFILTVAALESGQLVFHAVFVNLRRFALKLLLVGLVAGSSPWQRWCPAGLLVFHAVFVNLRRFALKLLPVGLVAGLLLWLALVILRGLIVHFELFHHRVLHL
jgi:hypothetical protein